MNDEIKEILDKLKETADYPKLNYSSYDKSYNETIDNVAMIKSFACKQLLDYITNLEQENERLKEELENKCWDEASVRADILLEQDDYKSRVEKAVEYNKQIITDTKDFYRPTTDTIYSGDCIIDIAKNNINILQNGSDDNG